MIFSSSSTNPHVTRAPTAWDVAWRPLAQAESCGLRLSGMPSAMDNRPLRFEEFETRVGQTVYVSATPGPFELTKSAGVVVEQIIRPTGLVDPQVEIRPNKGQIDNLLAEIRERAEKNQRVLVTNPYKTNGGGPGKLLQPRSGFAVVTCIRRLKRWNEFASFATSARENTTFSSASIFCVRALILPSVAGCNPRCGQRGVFAFARLPDPDHWARCSPSRGSRDPLRGQNDGFHAPGHR